MRTTRLAAIAATIAMLVIPGAAFADPTASQITAPVDPSFVTFDSDNPNTLHVAGTTSGGAGNVDVLCYRGSSSETIAKNVAVTNGAFSADIQLTSSLLFSFTAPDPYCALRAVPTGTTPVAPPDQPSPWQGPHVGWGWHSSTQVGDGLDPVPPSTLRDYYASRSQSRAFDDYDSAGACGLCDVFLFDPNTFAPSHPIWWADAYFPYQWNLSRYPVRIDGVDVYTGPAAYALANGALADNPGFPGISYSDSVDPATGDLTIHETDPFAACAPQPATYPPTDASCTSFAAPVVRLKRTIVQRDEGRQVAVVDRWQSADGNAHQLDAIYDDTNDNKNYAMAGHDSLWDFSWTQDGFTTYPPQTAITAPKSAPATTFLKTDGSTPDAGDGSNPIGALTYGSVPAQVTFVRPANAQSATGEWRTRYEKTIPAGGEVVIVTVYSHDFALASVQALAQSAETAMQPPAIAITSPADQATVSTAGVTVTGTASSADGTPSVSVNGKQATVANDGSWSVDVPLSEGTNTVTAEALNSIGVPAQARRVVTYQPAPAPQPVSDPAPAPSVTTTATTTAALPPAVHCVVPKLRGRSVAAARRLLVRGHCRLGKVTRKASARVRPGRVIRARLKPGATRAAGARIPVTVAARR